MSVYGALYVGRTAYFIGRAVCVRLRRVYAGKFVKFAPFNCLARVLRTFYVHTLLLVLFHFHKLQITRFQTACQLSKGTFFRPNSRCPMGNLWFRWTHHRYFGLFGFFYFVENDYANDAETVHFLTLLKYFASHIPFFWLSPHVLHCLWLVKKAASFFDQSHTEIVCVNRINLLTA